MEDSTILRNSSVNWGERSDYRPATLEDFKYPQKLRFAFSHINVTYTNSAGFILKHIPKSNTWVHTNFPHDPSLFVIKKPKPPIQL